MRRDNYFINKIIKILLKSLKEKIDVKPKHFGRLLIINERMATQYII